MENGREGHCFPVFFLLSPQLVAVVVEGGRRGPALSNYNVGYLRVQIFQLSSLGEVI